MLSKHKGSACGNISALPSNYGWNSFGRHNLSLFRLATLPKILLSGTEKLAASERGTP
jgi:hypothetical protein